MTFLPTFSRRHQLATFLPRSPRLGWLPCPLLLALRGGFSGTLILCMVFGQLSVCLTLSTATMFYVAKQQLLAQCLSRNKDLVNNR